MPAKTCEADKPAGNKPIIQDRRSSPRFRCCHKCNVRPENGTGAGTWQGIVYNISTGGIGVVLPCPLVTGTNLVIELFGGKKDLSVRACVVRFTLHAFAYFHGCEFAEPLSEAQVKSWLK